MATPSLMGIFSPGNPAPRQQARPQAAPAARKAAPAIAADSFQRVAQAPRFPATSQVTGNGFGFGVFDPATGGLSKFYVHPYRFEKQDPKHRDGEGISTANVLSKLAWAPAAAGAPEYLDQSQVLTAATPAGKASFMMPFGLNRAAMVTTLAGGRDAALDLQWAQKVTSKKQIAVNGRPAWVVTLAGVKETQVVVPLAGGAGKPTFGDKQLKGASGWAIVSVESPKEAAAAVADVQKWQGATPTAGLAQREARDMDQWRVALPAQAKTDGERKLWRQSETVLRMGQIREANTKDRHANGLILASLPEGEWFVPWVRDMTYATVGLTRMGHQAEAKQALDAMLNARGMGQNRGKDDPYYQISTVRYFGNGTEEADVSGAPRRNVEYDSWGLALWAMGEYYGKFQDKKWLDEPTHRGTVYSEMRDDVVKPLLAKTDAYKGGLIVAADTSVWEQNEMEKKHYAFSTLTAINGLNAFLPIARAKGDTATVKLVERKLALLHKGFDEAFVKDGKLRGTLEASPRNAMDGALLEALEFGVVKDPKLVQGTLDRMADLKTASGGYRRVTADSGYELQEFVWVDLALARVLRAQGREDEARALEDKVTAKSNEQNGQIAEMVTSTPTEEFDGAVGSPTGAIPMVGYGASAWVMNMLTRKAQ